MRFGLFKEDIATMRVMQGGRCEICGDRLRGDLNGPGKSMEHVDHDHACCPSKQKTCGKCIRALLCSPCNQGLGNFHDDPRKMRAAAAYIERWAV